jgi:hypothetical protein
MLSRFSPRGGTAVLLTAFTVVAAGGGVSAWAGDDVPDKLVLTGTYGAVNT